MNGGDVKVLLVHGANPAYDLPQDAGFVAALDNVETVISFNVLVDETSVQADYILPDRVYLEGWGYEVARPGFQGLPVVSSQQPVVGPLYDVRPTGDVLLTVAKGIPAAAQALPWTDEVAFIKEMVSALPKGASGGDDQDVRWARYLQHGGWWPETAPSAALKPAALQTLDVSATTFQGDAAEFKYFLQPYLSVLLGDSSGANTPWLQGSPDPMTTIAWQTWVELNPTTAKDLGVDNGDVITITSPHGEIKAPVYIFPAIRPDTVAIPLGQGHTDLGRYAKKRGSNALLLVGNQLDESGNYLAWANVRVKLTKTDATKPLALLESTVEQSKEAEIPF
jgi:anaerobic selenocysteine-containing dehydrogenase